MSSLKSLAQLVLNFPPSKPFTGGQRGWETGLRMLLGEICIKLPLFFGSLLLDVYVACTNYDFSINKHVMHFHICSSRGGNNRTHKEKESKRKNLHTNWMQLLMAELQFLLATGKKKTWGDKRIRWRRVRKLERCLLVIIESQERLSHFCKQIQYLLISHWHYKYSALSLSLLSWLLMKSASSS